MQEDAVGRRTIPSLLSRAVERFAEEPFIITADRSMTFGEAEQRSRRLAERLLGAGVGKGTRVGMLFPQGDEFGVVFLAITRAGALAVPLSTFLAPPELRRVVRHTDLHLLLTPHLLHGAPIEAALEAAMPELAGAGSSDLRLSHAPYLREIWTLGGGGGGGRWAVTPDLVPGEGDAITDFLDRIEAEVVPSDLAVTISTSGTTSEPKSVVHTHDALVGLASRLVGLHELERGVRTFTNMPFFWVGGLTVSLLTHLVVGGAVVTVERMDGPTTLDLIERSRPDRLVGWSLLDRLRADPALAGRDLGWLADLEVPSRSQVPRHGSLGMSETAGPHSGAAATVNRVGIPDELRGSFGPPVPGMAHRIVDPVSGRSLDDGVEGEICVRGEFMMDGLYKQLRRETFDPDGWYHTGDRGRVVDGLLFFTGRLSDMIKTSGANVAPAEVQSAVESLPGVRAAFVVGVPDAARGELVGCVVCPEDGLGLDGDSVRDQLVEHLSSFKIPRRIVVVPYDEAPLLPSGKVDRRAVIALLSTVD